MKALFLVVFLLAVCQAQAAIGKNLADLLKNNPLAVFAKSASAVQGAVVKDGPGNDGSASAIISLANPNGSAVHIKSARDLVNTESTKDSSATAITDFPVETGTPTLGGAAMAFVESPATKTMDQAAVASHEAAVIAQLDSMYGNVRTYASNGWITAAAATASGSHHGSSSAHVHPHQTGGVPVGFFSTGVVVATWEQCQGKSCSTGYAVYPAAYPTWYSYNTCKPEKAITSTIVPPAAASSDPVTIGPFDIADATECYYTVDGQLSCKSQPDEPGCAFCAGTGCKGNCYDDSWIIGGTCGW